MNTTCTVSKEWLFEHMNDSDVIIADCRFDLKDAKAGREAYRKSHIPGALFFDLKNDLSGNVGTHGGRHPLPDPEVFAQQLREKGINKEKHVVIYDDDHGQMAGRLWWLLHYVGQKNASIMDENFSEWMKQGYPVTTEVPKLIPVSFESDVNENMVISMDELKQRKDRNGVSLVDARAPERYNGTSEPLDHKAGHIPGAINMFWKDNLAARGVWKPEEDLRAMYDHLRNEEEVIVYCGSGVSANANIIAMQKAGLKNIKLYPGSWSDWISYEDNEVEKD
ncbi:sulfurtransferase [Geomicrobium sp. JSM 1781026]|uniref:sulfurtransferase n=1 Tax=Geomicrobium sp. JSM 1781026 TaxID=3344580 RepID=UPI0035BEFA90